MKQHGTYLVPTLETRECVGSNYPPEFVAKASQLHDVRSCRTSARRSPRA